MKFKDRFDAGATLARRLTAYKGKPCIVLAIPRGGVQVGVVIAKELQAPLEPVLVKKIGHPFNPEYAIGAVSTEDSVIYVVPDNSEEYIQSQIQKLQKLLRERETTFLQGQNPANLQGKIVILVDDGIATGSTITAALTLLRKQKPAKIIVAAPVAPSHTLESLQKESDEFVCLHTPKAFSSIGEFYERFDQVDDEEVIRLLKDSKAFL